MIILKNNICELLSDLYCFSLNYEKAEFYLLEICFKNITIFYKLLNVYEKINKNDEALSILYKIKEIYNNNIFKNFVFDPNILNDINIYMINEKIIFYENLVVESLKKNNVYKQLNIDFDINDEQIDLIYNDFILNNHPDSFLNKNDDTFSTTIKKLELIKNSDIRKIHSLLFTKYCL